MTDLELWKAFLTSQKVGHELWSENGITASISLHGSKVHRYWAGCDIYFRDDGSFDRIEIAE